MKNVLFLVLGLSLANIGYTCSEDGSDGFVPENDIYIPVNAKRLGGITETQFNDVITKIETIYAPIVTSMGGNLKVNRKWTDGTANANASRSTGSTWLVNMYGGLARHNAITEDGFALVLCHEIGHHLGGAPKSAGLLGLNRWASNEGQADYFATLKCLRKAFINDNNAAIVKKMDVPAALTDKCAATYSNKEERAICVRNGMAGASVAGFFADMRNAARAQFDTPDTSIVKKTNDAHPAHQCRLDTYFQGAICDISMNEDVSQKDEVQGTCHGTLGHTQGLRPLCWFKPAKN